jgi:outer membrane protein assembly factor BamD
VKKILQYGCILIMMAGCTSSDKAEDAAKEEVKSAETLYTEARDLLAEGRFKQSAELFDDIERQHPYSEWASVAQIMSGYSYYRQRDYDNAILTCERFIKLHPGSDSVAYAYYLIAQSYYEQISDVGRDQGMTRKALEALRTVARRFPNSDYARDAKLKLDLTRDHLAGKEMSIGRYYQAKQEYLAAANRFRSVVESYDTTTHTPEALHRLVEIYLSLGVVEQAERYGAVLGHNYPETKWYELSYALLKGKPATAKPKKTGWDIF